MNTIQELFQQAQLAEATYANLTSAIGNQSELKKALDMATGDGKFSATQAASFATRYQVISQYTAPSGMLGLTDGTGFSATLFLDTTTGQYTLATRGTEPG
ncbi:MAG: hypothetical protein PHQ60_11910, partial [Sideroxydans sp.]|nr:hypothetical protein [Sideroxydans sp.]